MSGAYALVRGHSLTLAQGTRTSPRAAPSPRLAHDGWPRGAFLITLAGGGSTVDTHVGVRAIRKVGNVRWWLRSLASGAAVGFVVGLVVGGTLGRVFMRLLTLAREDAVGFQTAMGAIVGDFTGPGTTRIYAFGAFAGVLIGVGYAAGRRSLPAGMTRRTILFTLGTTAFMLGQIVRGNREDFSFLPVTLSLLLIGGSVALTALPVPLLVERLAPDRERRLGRLAQGVTAVGMTGFVAFGVTGVVIAYTG